MNKLDMFKFLYKNNLNNIFQTSLEYDQRYGTEYTLGMLGNINNGYKTAYDIINKQHDITINCNYPSIYASTLNYDAYDQSISMLPFKSKVQSPLGQSNNKICQGTNYFFIKIKMEQIYTTNSDFYYPSFKEQHWQSIGITPDNTLSWTQGQSMYEIINYENELYNIYFPTSESNNRIQNTLWFECMNYYRYIDPKWRIGYPLEAAPQIYNEYIPYWNTTHSRNTNFYIWGNCKNNNIHCAAYISPNTYIEHTSYISPIPLYNVYLKEGIVWNNEITMSDDDESPNAKIHLQISFNYDKPILSNEPNTIKEWLKSINI